ncbi:MAG: aminoacyl-tRNA hydrolase [Thalassobaculales bacterium]
MLLMVGLGNPGPEHARQRHNIGFMALDAIHAAGGFGPWRARYQGYLAEQQGGGPDRALLLKPLTYMNESGRSVGEAVRFLKIAPERVVVFHDEMDLKPGKVKVKSGGGAAGHNGLRSLDAAIGQGYRRVRLGIGHPGDRDRVLGYVLQNFAKAEQPWLDRLLAACAAHWPLLAEGRDNMFMTRLAEAVFPPPPPKPKPAAPPPAASDTPPPEC